ncbi:hypothetical protein FGB62_10g32 [Gracilaria domingensis]|nr:hypothetical protein FGB62_10g32 [Gracilaria domingensis]
MVPELRRLASLPPTNQPCMNVSEFALALSRVQERADFDLQKLDVHIRPQRLYHDAVPYDLVLDIADLSNVSAISPIIRRLPFGALVRAGITHRHASGSYELLVPERAVKLLLRFAAESETLPVKYG